MDSTVQQVWVLTFNVTDAGLRLCSGDSSEQTGTAESLDWDCFCLTAIFQKIKETLNQRVCWKRPEQLCTSPTTALLLPWPQTCSQPSKNIIRTCPSRQRFIRAFHQQNSFTLSPLAASPAGNVFVLTPVPGDHNCTRTRNNFSTYIRRLKNVTTIFCFPSFLSSSIFAEPTSRV